MTVVMTPDKETLPLGEPAYYEVWGGLESANKALWMALWFSTTVAVLALILVRVALWQQPQQLYCFSLIWKGFYFVRYIW